MSDQPPSSSSRSIPSLPPVMVVAATAVAVAFLTACPLEFEDLDEPQILNVTISPSQIERSEIGSSKTFDAEISTANFDGELDPDRAQVFIENEEQIAYPSDVYVDGNIVLLEGIGSNWFQDHDQAGNYNIGASVASDTASARALNQAVVTVND